MMEEAEYHECEECGSRIDDDDLFCRGCGRPIRERGEVFPPGEGKKHRRWLYAALAAGGIAILCGVTFTTLYLIVWGRVSGGADSPEALVDKYMESLETEDVESYMECFEFEHFEEVWGEGINEEYARFMVEAFMLMGDIRFEGVEPRVVSKDEDVACMRANKGKIITTGFFMPIDYDVVDYPMTFEMYRKDGKWFLAGDPMKDIVAPGPNP